jgi:ATP/maltotriose-dependent transcriptional regulator MalT
LRELEQANAFVVALDTQRSWFRYHPLFADLLQLELLDTAQQDELARLHGTAAGWFAEHGFVVEAVRHAQLAQDWGLAARLLVDHWFGLALDGKAATADELLAGFPVGLIAADAELTALLAARELNAGSFADAERNLRLAEKRCASVSADRRGHLQVTLAMLRLTLAQLRSDLPVAVEEAQRLVEPAVTQAAAEMGLGEELHAMALLKLGTTEFWTGRFEDAERQADRLVSPHPLAGQVRASRLQTLVRMGATEQAEKDLAELGENERGTGELRAAFAVLRLAQGDPLAATLALGPVIDGSAPVIHRVSVTEALVLEATARDALGSPYPLTSSPCSPAAPMPAPST